MAPSTEELARLVVDIQTNARTERKPPTNAQLDTLIDGLEHILSNAGDTLTKAEVAVVVGATAGLRDTSEDLDGTPHDMNDAIVRCAELVHDYLLPYV